MHIRSFIRHSVRSFTTRVYFPGLGRMVDLFNPILQPVDGSEIISIKGIPFRFGFDGPAERRMYYGLYEPSDVAFVKDNTPPASTFIDVGANIGYVTAIAAGQVGKNGSVHSFEPIPEYFNRLKQLSTSASDYKIVINQCAVGDKEGRTQIRTSKSSNIGWSTIVHGFMNDREVKEIIDVPIITLDSYIESHQLENITFIKIDVEGAEFLVLKGLFKFLSSNQQPIILCEVCVPANELLGLSVRELFRYMSDLGYHSYRIKRGGLRPIDHRDLQNTSNVVWIKV